MCREKTEVVSKWAGCYGRQRFVCLLWHMQCRVWVRNYALSALASWELFPSSLLFLFFFLACWLFTDSKRVQKVSRANNTWRLTLIIFTWVELGYVKLWHALSIWHTSFTWWQLWTASKMPLIGKVLSAGAVPVVLRSDKSFPLNRRWPALSCCSPVTEGSVPPCLSSMASAASFTIIRRWWIPSCVVSAMGRTGNSGRPVRFIVWQGQLMLFLCTRDHSFARTPSEVMHSIILRSKVRRSLCCSPGRNGNNTRSLSPPATFQRTIAALAGGGPDTHVPVRGVWGRHQLRALQVGRAGRGVVSGDSSALRR